MCFTNMASTPSLLVCVIGCLQRNRPKVDANIDVFIESSLSAECSLVILDTVEELIQVGRTHTYRHTLYRLFFQVAAKS